MPWRGWYIFFSWANSSVGTQSYATSPGRSAGRSDPNRPWYVRVLDATGVRVSDETSKTVVLDSLESKREGRLLAGST